MKLILATSQDIHRAIALNRWLTRAAVSRLTIALPGLDDTEARRLERRLLRLFNTCGCGVSALVFVASMVITGLYWAAVEHLSALILLVMFIASVFIAFGVKLLVLCISHVRLHRTLLGLLREEAPWLAER